jgi:TPR repeat protein
MTRTGGIARRSLLLGTLAAPFTVAAQRALAQTQSNTDLQEGLRAYAQRNYAGALRLWAPLAQRGDTAAQYNIGRLYARGEGVARDLPEAYKWFTLSAAGGRREGEQARQAIVRSMTPVQQAEGMRRAEAWRRQQLR